MKHKLVKQSDIIKAEGNTIKRLKKTCPRCGLGTYMAEHGDRYFCGNCHMTEWKKKE